MNNSIKKLAKHIVTLTIVASMVSACGGDDNNVNNRPYTINNDIYAGCIVPPGQKFKSVIGKFSDGILYLDLYYSGAGLTEAVGELQIYSLESLYMIDTFQVDPLNPPVNHVNQQYRTCVSSEGALLHTEAGSSTQNIDLALRGSSVFIESEDYTGTWLSGDSLLGKMRLELQQYPAIDVIMNQ